MLALLRRLAFWTVRPVWRILLRVMPTNDAWERLTYRAPVRRYGVGAKHDFAWYFEGSSSISLKSIDEVQDWLIECRYIRDPELFREVDVWQHPLTFEQLRQGDCEDHALWAWRKLIELGYDADLVSGRCLPWNPAEQDERGGHVWVVFRSEGNAYLFETTAKAREHMVRRLADVARDYRPEFGVDRMRQRFTFNGILLTLRDREFGVRPSESSGTSMRGFPS